VKVGGGKGANRRPKTLKFGKRMPSSVGRRKSTDNDVERGFSMMHELLSKAEKFVVTRN